MNSFIPVIAKLLAVLTVVTDIAIVLYLFLPRFRNFVTPIVSPYARILAFIVALVAMGGSLFFSEIAKYTPCLLCWWQRIFMYPQTILIAMGIIKNDRNSADYAIGLSAVGGSIALYHYYIQLGGKTFFSCAQVGFSASCTERFTLEFGYVSIPMMALTAFAAIIILMTIYSREAR